MSNSNLVESMKPMASNLSEKAKALSTKTGAAISRVTRAGNDEHTGLMWYSEEEEERRQNRKNKNEKYGDDDDGALKKPPPAFLNISVEDLDGGEDDVNNSSYLELDKAKKLSDLDALLDKLIRESSSAAADAARGTSSNFDRDVFGDGLSGGGKKKNARPRNCPEENSRWYSHLLYNFANPLINLGYKRPLDYEDLWDLKPTDETKESGQKLVEVLLKEQETARKEWEQLKTARRAASEEREALLANQGRSIGEAEEREEMKRRNSEGAEKTTLDLWLGRLKWIQQLKGKKEKDEVPMPPFLWRALKRVYGHHFWRTFVLKLVHDVIMFLSPFILERLLHELNKGVHSRTACFWLSLALLICSVFENYFVNMYFIELFRMSMHLKSGFITLLYSKALRITSAAKHSIGVGPIVNLQSNDASKIWNMPMYVHILWNGPFQILVVMGLLVRVMGWGPSFAGLAVTITIIPATMMSGKALATSRREQVKHTDARIKLCSEVVTGIKAIKFYAWEQAYVDRILKLREQELKQIRRTNYLNVINTITFFSGPILVSIAAFGTFSAMHKGRLTSSTAFPALALFNLLRFPILMFPSQVMGMIQARVSLARLQKFFQADEIEGISLSGGKREEEEEEEGGGGGGGRGGGSGGDRVKEGNNHSYNHNHNHNHNHNNNSTNELQQHNHYDRLGTYSSDVEDNAADDLPPIAIAIEDGSFTWTVPSSSSSSSSSASSKAVAGLGAVRVGGQGESGGRMKDATGKSSSSLSTMGGLKNTKATATPNASSPLGENKSGSNLNLNSSSEDAKKILLPRSSLANGLLRQNGSISGNHNGSENSRPFSGPALRVEIEMANNNNNNNNNNNSNNSGKATDDATGKGLKNGNFATDADGEGNNAVDDLDVEGAIREGQKESRDKRVAAAASTTTSSTSTTSTTTTALRRVIAAEQHLEAEAVKLVLEEEALAAAASNLVLKEIRLAIRQGQLIIVVGEVGSGKSSLLAALLGELHCTGGGVRRHPEIAATLAYTSQDPWIQHATLRDNILMGSFMQPKKYAKVLTACALVPDLDLLPAGDLSEIGEKGINLSGGQKHRVALARACYSDASVFLLDDPLSAVDAHVGRHLFEKCICQYLGGKTRVLVTHQLQYLPAADVVVVISNGRIQDMGSYDDLLARGVDFNRYVHEEEEDEREREGELVEDGEGQEGNVENAEEVMGKTETINAKDKYRFLLNASLNRSKASMNTLVMPESAAAAASLETDGGNSAVENALRLLKDGQEEGEEGDRVCRTGKSSLTSSPCTRSVVNVNDPDGVAARLHFSDGDDSSSEVDESSSSLRRTNGNNASSGPSAALRSCGHSKSNNNSTPSTPAGKALTLAAASPSSSAIKEEEEQKSHGNNNNSSTISLTTTGRKNSALPSSHSLVVDFDAVIEERQALVDVFIKKQKEGKLVKVEDRALGSVDWRYYLEYLRSWSPYFVLPLLMVTLAISERVFGSLQNFVLSAWTNKTQAVTSVAAAVNATSDSAPIDQALSSVHAGSYLTVYLVFGFLAIALQVFRCFALVIGSIRAGRELQRRLLAKVVRLPMSFFDSQPTGRLLNRFTKDMESMDITLGGSVMSSMTTFTSAVFSVIIVLIVTPVASAALIPLSVLYIRIQRLYIASSRELKRLDSVAFSPIFQHFGESLHGLVTIRAFGKQDVFLKRNIMNVDHSNRCYWPIQVLNRWLSARLEMMGAIVVFSTSLLVAVIMPRSSGLAGLALTSAMSLTGIMNWMVRQTTDLEVNMNSIERILEYERYAEEAPAHIPQVDPKGADDWPTMGVIEARDLVVKYRPELEPVLCGISFSVPGRSKVGVCGRTGCGKSTLMLALYRMVEPTEGTIFIDGVDIRGLGITTLRSRLSLVPQDPVIFSGTVRSNLDPFGAAPSDAVIWEALSRAGLQAFVEESSLGLDTPIQESGGNLSVGQRQLLCMARALLRVSKILVLDEATSNVDNATDAMIQNTIRSAFKDCTVLTIAHRLHTIIDSDRILVLEAGRVAEFDSPAKLLAKESGPDAMFKSLVEEAARSGGGAGVLKEALRTAEASRMREIEAA